MDVDHADDLVPFLDVTVISSEAPALFCKIGDLQVWLPRQHIRGKLWCTGDHGTLFIRRWIARDRHLIGADAVASLQLAISRPHPPGRLHLVEGTKGRIMPSKGSALR